MIFRQRGFSLVELMIGLTIGLLILTVLSSLLVNNSKARVDLDQSMQQVENGRYAMQMLGDELRQAGFYGEGQIAGSAPASLPDPCKMTVADMTAALPLPVQGYPLATSIPSCLSSANVATGQDILVIRRALTSTVTLANLGPTGTYIQTVGTKSVLDVGSNSGAFSLTTKSGSVGTIHPYAVFIYFISPCDVPAGGGTTCTGAGDDNGKPIPTLKRVTVTASGTSAPVSLVQGIEQWRLQYGVDNSVDASGKPDQDGTPDSYMQPASVADWMNVTTVQVNLLARNTQQTFGYTDTKSYKLGDVTVTGSGPYKRHAYSSTFRLMGPYGTRER